jgi:ferritin-like metal-binding protein YciE
MINSLEDYYHDHLRDLYSIENQLVVELSEMVGCASDKELRDAFEIHLEETKRHLFRIARICEDHHIEADGGECEAMEYIIGEAIRQLARTKPGAVRDAVLIACATRFVHFEMAVCGAARSFAIVLGYDAAADLLDQTLEEQAAADATLGEIATTGISEAGSGGIFGRINE